MLLPDKAVKLRLEIVGSGFGDGVREIYINVVSMEGYSGLPQACIHQWCRQNGITAIIFPVPGWGGTGKMHDMRVRIANDSEATAFLMSWPHA